MQRPGSTTKRTTPGGGRDGHSERDAGNPLGGDGREARGDRRPAGQGLLAGDRDRHELRRELDQPGRPAPSSIRSSRLTSRRTSRTSSGASSKPRPVPSSTTTGSSKPATTSTG